MCVCSHSHRYLSWIRKDKQLKENLSKYLNALEADLRSHKDFAAIYEEDTKALADFRKIGDLGEYFVDEETATYTETATNTAATSLKASMRFKPRTSMGSSVSSIPSKVSGAGGSLESINEEEPGDDGSPGTPSPAKRSIVQSVGSVSSLDTRDPSPSLRKRRKQSSPAGDSVESKGSGEGDTSGDDEASPAKRHKSSPENSEALPTPSVYSAALPSVQSDEEESTS